LSVCLGICGGCIFCKILTSGTAEYELMLTYCRCKPGCLYYLSAWYTRKELVKRTALLYSGSLLSGAFSGLIAAGITSGLDGAKGLSAWRWLFIVEGSITVSCTHRAETMHELTNIYILGLHRTLRLLHFARLATNYQLAFRRRKRASSMATRRRYRAG
jgi:MFS family permease